MHCLCIVRRGDSDSRCPLLLNRICFATLSRELKTGAVIAAIGEVTSYLLLFTMWDILMGSLRYLHRFAPSHMIFSTELFDFQCCQCMHKLWKWNGQKKERKQDRYSGLSPFPRVVERKRHRKGQKRFITFYSFLTLTWKLTCADELSWMSWTREPRFRETNCPRAVIT